MEYNLNNTKPRAHRFETQLQSQHIGGNVFRLRSRRHQCFSFSWNNNKKHLTYVRLAPQHDLLVRSCACD